MKERSFYCIVLSQNNFGCSLIKNIYNTKMILNMNILFSIPYSNFAVKIFHLFIFILKDVNEIGCK